jgi:hypothetical protein
MAACARAAVREPRTEGSIVPQGLSDFVDSRSFAPVGRSDLIATFYVDAYGQVK